eukprot:jgi/Ulvmu1/9717/UM055_0055.1
MRAEQRRCLTAKDSLLAGSAGSTALRRIGGRGGSEGALVSDGEWGLLPHISHAPGGEAEAGQHGLMPHLRVSVLRVSGLRVRVLRRNALWRGCFLPARSHP